MIALSKLSAKRRLALRGAIGYIALLLCGSALAQDPSFSRGACRKGQMHLHIEGPALHKYGLVACSEVKLFLASGAQADIETLLVDKIDIQLDSGSRLKAGSLAAGSAKVYANKASLVSIQEGFAVSLTVVGSASSTIDLSGVRSSKAFLDEEPGSNLKIGMTRELEKAHRISTP